MTAKIKLSPSEWYSLNQLVEMNLFPWRSNENKTYRTIVDADRKSGNHLKAVIYGKGTGKRYRIKGENIISFLAKVDDGTVRL